MYHTDFGNAWKFSGNRGHDLANTNREYYTEYYETIQMNNILIRK